MAINAKREATLHSCNKNSGRNLTNWWQTTHVNEWTRANKLIHRSIIRRIRRNQYVFDQKDKIPRGRSRPDTQLLSLVRYALPVLPCSVNHTAIFGSSFSNCYLLWIIKCEFIFLGKNSKPVYYYYQKPNGRLSPFWNLLRWKHFGQSLLWLLNILFHFLRHVWSTSALEGKCPIATRGHYYRGEGDRQPWSWNFEWHRTT